MFDWQTGEDGRVWQELETAAPPPPPPRSRYFLLLPLFFALVLAGGGYYGYQQVRQRMNSNIRAAQTAVLTSHELIIQATATTDTELFTNLLSGRDSRWTNTQVTLFRDHLLYNRPQLGLATAEIRAGNPTITLSADLTQALVARPVRYTILGTGEQIQLEQIALFRQGTERWLMAPLESDPAWVEEERFHGQRLSATYPRTDAEAAQTILAALDNDLQHSCLLFDMACPPNMRVNLRLTADSRTLLAILPENRNPSTAPLSISENYNLPTPALLGRPLDEAGAQAIYAGYVEWVLGDVLRRGLRPYWEDHPTLYQFAVNNRLTSLLDEPSPTPPLPPADILYQQDIAALCLAGEGLTLVQYRPPLATQTQIRRRLFLEMFPAPDGRVVALQESIGAQSEFALWLPNSQTTLHLFSTPSDWFRSLAWRTHPDDPKLVSMTSATADLSNAQFTHTALNQCNTTTCSFTSTRLPYDMVWSSNGQRTLIPQQGGRLFLGDGDGIPQIWVGMGQRPFWLDDNRYLYLSLADLQSGPNILYTAEVEPPNQRILLTGHDLLATLPEGERPLTMSLIYAAPFGSPNDSLLLWGLGGVEKNGRPNPLFVFQYELATAELHFIFTAPQVFAVTPAPLGNQVAGLVVDHLTNQPEIHLYDIATGGMDVFPLPSTADFLGLEWSADGQWLLATAGGQPYLIHPSTAALYRTPLSGCTQAVWVESSD